tara:strand:- start:304 stop:702 length:399 start_codon:yes stop_codon:yes gene_type:complete
MNYEFEAKIMLNNIDNDQEFNAMIQSINDIYSKDKSFQLFIETQNVRHIKIQYLYKFGRYLNSLKSRTPQHLKSTRIHVYDDLIFNLLYTLFTFISSPIAKVSVIYYEGGYTTTLPYEQRVIKKIKEYHPHR